jgi:hypothetical protein
MKSAAASKQNPVTNRSLTSKRFTIFPPVRPWQFQSTLAPFQYASGKSGGGPYQSKILAVDDDSDGWHCKAAKPQPNLFGLRWQSAAATPLFACGPSFQSGVALRFPPQSKTLRATR